MAKYEKPQKKNRHLLTVRQHVFPLASIARFADAEGRVSLQDLARCKVRLAKPDDGIFCARRAWDQRAERGYMKRIEDEFQILASKIVEGALSEIGAAENGVFNRFYALWQGRARRRNLPQQEIGLDGVTGGGGLSRDQEENLEISGYSFMRDGKFLGRHLNGILLQLMAHRYGDELQQAQWGIIRAATGEFIVPDIPMRPIIPLTPDLCLISGGVSGVIFQPNVAEINQLVRAESQGYFFARDLSSCPF
jgi:hypothetical protein